MKSKSAVQNGLEEINSNDFFALYLDNRETFLLPYQKNKHLTFYAWLYDQYILSLVNEINNFNMFLEQNFPYKRDILNENIRLILAKLNITLSNTIALLEPILSSKKELCLNNCDFILLDQQSENELKKQINSRQYILYDKRHIDNFCSNVFHTLKYFLSFFIDYKAKPKEFEDYIIQYFNDEYESDMKNYDNYLVEYKLQLKEWNRKKVKGTKPKKPKKPTHDTSITAAIKKAKAQNRYSAYHKLFNKFLGNADTKLNNDYRSKVILQLRKYRMKLNEQNNNPPDKLIEISIK